MEDVCAAAEQSGLRGLAVTDHCDCESAITDRVFDRIDASVHDARTARAAFADRLTVMTGVELGDALFDPDFAGRILASFPFDVVLGSVHAVRSEKNDAPFSRIDFSGWTENELHLYLKQYFSDVRDTLLTFDFDVLSHLTVPLRYINEKYNKNVDAAKYSDQIRDILLLVIQQGRTLEINTQGVSSEAALIHPEEWVVDLYLSLGGTAFCLGSDAHTPEAVGNGLLYGAQLLRNKGISQLCFFEQRNRRDYSF